MIPRFRSRGREVEAILFDGSHESAADVSARFGAYVARHDNMLQVATQAGPIFIGMGCWVMRDCATRRLDVMDARDFEGAFEPVPDDEVAPLDRHFFGPRPCPRSWDVA